MAVIRSVPPDSSAEQWRDQAACRRCDPDLFFPIGETGSACLQIEAAKSVCRTCPVRRACLEYALETNQDAGVWGAADEGERRRMRAARRGSRTQARQSVNT